MTQEEVRRVSGLCYAGRHAPARARYVTEDGQEKEVCADHFAAFQQMELVAEYRRKKLESIRSVQDVTSK